MGDRDGNMFDGKSTYKLNVPADTLAKDFWSVIVYSMESKGFIIDAPVVGLSAHNQDTLQFNEDGSADIYHLLNDNKEPQSLLKAIRDKNSDL